jgi:hypothetical protein
MSDAGYNPPLGLNWLGLPLKINLRFYGEELIIGVRDLYFGFMETKCRIAHSFYLERSIGNICFFSVFFDQDSFLIYLSIYKLQVSVSVCQCISPSV